MKKTLLTTTALVALAGAATAEITVSGTARLGLQTTEGTAAVVASTAYGTVTAEMITSATAANDSRWCRHYRRLIQRLAALLTLRY